MSTALADGGGPDPTAWPPMEGVTAAHGPALLEWAVGTSGSRSRLCLIRGAGRSGKSRLLAWFLSGSAGHPRTTVHAMVPCDGGHTDAVAWELGRQLGYGPLSPGRLLERLTVDQRPLLIFLPDLHLAGRGPADRPAADPAALTRDLVVPLLEMPQVRAIVEVGRTTLLDTWPGAESIDVGDVPLAWAEKPDGENLLAQVERTNDGRPRWDMAPREVREHALDQALLAPDADRAVLRLLSDPGCLLYGSAVSIAACLADERVIAPPGLRQVWQQAAPQLSDAEHDMAQRAAILHTAALGAGPTLARYLLPLAERHVFTAVWSRPGAQVTALARFPGEPGEPVGLVAADPLGGLSVLDPATGRVTAGLSSPATVRPEGIAAGLDRTLLLLDESGCLHPASGDPAADPEAAASTILGHIAAHHGQAALKDPRTVPTALGQCPYTGATVVGDESGGVHLWNGCTHQSAPTSRNLHQAPVTAATCLTLPGDGDRPSVVLSAGMDGAVGLWATAADPMPAPIERRPAIATALAAANTPQGPVLAVAWNDARVHMWHLPTGRVRPVPLLVRCQSLALTEDAHLTIGGPDGTYTLALDTARLWD